MVLGVFGGQYLWIIRDSPLTGGILVLVAGGLGISIGYLNNKSHMIKVEKGNFGTGNIVYSDVLVWNYVNILFSWLPGAMTAWMFVGTFGNLGDSTAGNVFLGSILIWLVWTLVSNVATPLNYVVTNSGIWYRYSTIPAYVSFDEIEKVCYEPGFRIVWTSDYSNPVARFNQYIVVNLKKEVKLHKESHRKHFTPSDPLEFLSQLPQELIQIPDQQSGN